MRLLVVALVLVCAGEAAGHHGASRWGPLHRARYLICTRAPATRVHCVGPIRARQHLLDALQLGRLDPDRNNDDRLGPAHDAAVDAVYFHVTAAVPLLRTWLARRPEPAELGKSAAMAKQALRAEAAYALAHLGDPQAAPAIADLVVELETGGHGTLWADTLDALAVIDPARASRYAIDFLGRTSNFRTSMPGGSSKLGALDHVRVEDAALALPVLERLAAAEARSIDRVHAHCELMALRVRLDPRLAAEVRKQLVGSYSGTWLAGCANAVLRRLVAVPDDAAALIRHLGRDDRGMDFGVANLAYQRLLELIVAMDQGPAAAATRRAREVLRRGLIERSAWPHVADPRHASYALHFVAFHHAALAGLGDAGSRRTLFALIDDARDQTGSAWIAALWALRLGLPGAPDHVATLVARGVTYANTARTGVFRGIRTRVLEELVARHPDDARWTVHLLDPDRDAAERALYRLSRRPPARACEVVTAAARIARPEAVEAALLGLTVMGDRCLPAIEQLFGDATVPAEVRGAALEFTAVLGSPRLCDHLARARRERVWAPAIERATRLLPRACQPPVRPPPHRRGDQPLPPRSHRQGM